MQTRIRLVTFGLLMGFVSAVGCSTVATSPELALGEIPPQIAPQVQQVSHDVPTFTMIVEPTEGDKMQAEQPLPQPIDLQSVLEQSGVQKRFRRMEIELWRPLPDGGHHKITIPFDRAARTVPPEYNYSLRPADRLVVREDDANMLDDVLNSLQLPFFE